MCVCYGIYSCIGSWVSYIDIIIRIEFVTFFDIMILVLRFIQVIAKFVISNIDVKIFYLNIFLGDQRRANIAILTRHSYFEIVHKTATHIYVP